MDRGVRATALLSCVLVVLVAVWVVGYGGEYTLVFKNESPHSGVVMVYQPPAETGVENTYAVACQTATVAPEAEITFRWSSEYTVSSALSGGISAGAIYTPATSTGVALVEGTQMTFDLSNGTFQETGQGGAIQQGTMQLRVIDGEADESVAIGVSIGGKPSLVVETMTNTQWVYKPSSIYHVAFGHFSEGMFLNVELISIDVEVEFQTGVYTMVVTLGTDVTMRVTTGGG